MQAGFPTLFGQKESIANIRMYSEKETVQAGFI